MIDQLSKIYPSLLVYDDGISDWNSSYKWFLTADNKIVGIHKEELTPKDMSLLAVFLEPYKPEFPPPTDEEQAWSKLIHSAGSEDNRDIKEELPYRFVYFSIKKNQISPLLFKNSIQELFGKQMPILWENGYSGIIIEYQAIDEESISYEQIIDILMSDLFIKINFFVGSFIKGLDGIANYHSSLINAAKTVFSYSNKPVLTFIDAVPFLLIEQTDPRLLLNIEKSILQEYSNDEEALKMIESFVENNLNISETAKALHMHRNSLQYRLDRFHENTGLDVKKFSHALAAYLMILAKE